MASIRCGSKQQEFRLREYHAFLASIEPKRARFKRRQQAAFEAERERWARAGPIAFVEAPDATSSRSRTRGRMPEGCRAVRSPVTASVWNIAVEAGQRVEAGREADRAGSDEDGDRGGGAQRRDVIEMLNCAQGALVLAGQNLVTLRQEVGCVKLNRSARCASCIGRARRSRRT